MSPTPHIAFSVAFLNSWTLISPHIVQVLCAGRRNYVNYNGSPVRNRDSLTRHTSGKVDQMLLDGLKVNFNYSCVVTGISGATHGSGVLTNNVVFTTSYGGNAFLYARERTITSS